MSLGREEVEEALADVSQHVKSARQLHASSSQSTSSSSQYPLDGLHTVRLIDPISRAYTLVSSDVEETIRSKIQREKKQVEEKEIMSRRLAETPEYVREQANSLRLLMASSQDAGVIDSQKKLLELREQVWSNKSKKKQEDDVGDEQLELVLVGGGEWESRVCNEKIFYVNKVTKETTWFHPFTLSQPLPPGWEKVQDGGGRIMYRRGTEVTYVHPNLSPAYLDALSQQSSLWKRLTPLLGSKSDTRLNDSARAHDAVMQFVTPEHRELAVRQATFLAGPAWSKARGESSSLVASGALLRSFLKSLQSPVKMASAGWVLVHNTSLEDLTVCFECGVMAQGWIEGDDPFQIHSRLNPHCAFVKRQLVKPSSQHQSTPYMPTEGNRQRMVPSQQVVKSEAEISPLREQTTISNDKNLNLVKSGILQSLKQAGLHERNVSIPTSSLE